MGRVQEDLRLIMAIKQASILFDITKAQLQSKGNPKLSIERLCAFI
jgi:hypothetical protein